MKTILQSARLLLALTLLTGLAYPLVVTGLARAAFPRARRRLADERRRRLVGSELLAQKFESPRYFWPRPSAADYATVASGASNKGPTSADLAQGDRRTPRKSSAPDAPAEMLTASGSGLDPHLSPRGGAVAGAARGAGRAAFCWSKSPRSSQRLTEPPQLGFLGEPRVNILSLNRALDAVTVRLV